MSMPHPAKRLSAGQSQTYHHTYTPKRETMKRKFALVILLTVLLSACGLGPLTSLAPAETPTTVPTEASTFTPQPTKTPVLPTSTFTLTPTLVGYKTATPSPMVTDTPAALLFVPNTLPPQVQMDGFASVNISLTEIYKANRGCEPSVVRFNAQVANAAKAKYVLLFVRFKSFQTDRESKWTQIKMTPVGGGAYIHDLSTDQMLEDEYFESSWLEYQIVSTLENGKKLGGTDIFVERLKMLGCRPGGTPYTP